MTLRLFSLLAGILALVIKAESFKSFSESCLAIDGQFYGEDKVGFYCLTKRVEQFEYMYSLIDLRHCLANNVGSLIGYKDGDYHKTCEACTLKSTKDADGSRLGSCRLSCYCYDMDGQKHKTEVDLSNVLQNNDGRLVCYGYGGTRNLVPPECHHNPECEGKPRLSP